MRVLLTGGSSFTGSWIARALARAGAEVVAPLRNSATDGGPGYLVPARRTRVADLATIAEVVESCPFGGPAFLELIDERGPFDVLCLHHAEVGDFRRSDYAPLAAAQSTTAGLDQVLTCMAERGLRRIVHTGTVFEADEGDGDRPLVAIGAYGLAKTLTSQIIRHAAADAGVSALKITLASPYGPGQGGGFVPGLLEAWCRDEAAFLEQPDWVRDFQPVELLADHYAALALDHASAPRGDRANPSGHVRSVEAFAEMLAQGLRQRLGLACRLTRNPKPLPKREPQRRFNTEPMPGLGEESLGEASLDRLAEWARTMVEARAA